MDLWKRSSQASYSDREAAACARSRANLMRVIASLDALMAQGATVYNFGAIGPYDAPGNSMYVGIVGVSLN